MLGTMQTMGEVSTELEVLIARSEYISNKLYTAHPSGDDSLCSRLMCELLAKSSIVLIY